MKRNYISPAIETTEIMVEAGIAASVVELYNEGGFGLGDGTNYGEEETFAW